MATSRRILLLDAYDSFTNNLAALIRNVTQATVHTIKIDSYNFSEFKPFLKSFDAIVIGPGPGTPTNRQDVGIIPDIWNLSEEDMIPVFGVCLGFQSLCLAFGGQIYRLKVVKHGQSSIVRHSSNDLFHNCDIVDAIRYHSLHAILGEEELKHLAVLATADDGPEENGEVLMAVRHKTRPFWGVQYHPESCCTNPSGAQVVENWWRMTTSWLDERGRMSQPLPNDWKVPLRENSLLRSKGTSGPRNVIYKSFHAPCLSIVRLCELLQVKSGSKFAMLDSSAKHTGRFTIIGVFTDSITDTLTYKVSENKIQIQQDSNLCDGDFRTESLSDLQGGIWMKVSDYMDSRKAVGGDEESPFWGGFIGYFNYETGVAGLNVSLRNPRADEHSGTAWRPDVSLTFFHRSIVVDNVSGKVWVQTIMEGDEEWVSSMSESIQLAAAMSITPTATPPIGSLSNSASNQSRSGGTQGGKNSHISAPLFSPSLVKIQRPDKQRYMENVRRCQKELSLGESYELCLTGQTTVDILTPKPLNDGEEENNSWKIYQHLRKRNPAPFAGYYKASGTTLLSSSPERFLSWDRNGKFQLRPIKGTVRKSKSDGTTVSRKEAEDILNTPKERAENLMIVDLIRHDLHGVLDGQEDEDGGVQVTKLMGIEEYETVFQLVSVIEGNMGTKMRQQGFTGMDVLSRSLPPGSMTGAPKKRSVEILQEIESEANEGDNCGERAMYSGVLGYWSVCGAGDWSVIIRSMFRFDHEFEEENKQAQMDGTSTKERWRIGAGGAVTALSDPEGEWEEMLTKLNSTLAVFL